MTVPTTPATGSWLRADLRRFDLLVAVVVTALGSALALASPDSPTSGWPEVAAAGGAFVLLLGRRRFAVPAFVIGLVWVAVHIGRYERPTVMVFVVLVLLSTICVRLDRWRAVALGGAVALSLYVVGLLSTDIEFGDARAVIGVAWTAAAVGVADASRSWRGYRASAEAQLRSTVLAAEARANQEVSQERLAIARELHDLLAHNLSVMNVQTGAALHLLRRDPDRAEESLLAARDAGRTVLDELRDLLGVLRHDGASGEPVSSLPTFDELPALIDTMRATGLEVALHQRGAPARLSPAASLAAYRIVQEALTNAAKHGAGAAVVETIWADDDLRLRIENASIADGGDGGGRGGGGRGGGGAGTGHGLIGMRERATSNGGRLTAEASGSMFVVDARLPVVHSEGEMP